MKLACSAYHCQGNIRLSPAVCFPFQAWRISCVFFIETAEIKRIIKSHQRRYFAYIKACISKKCVRACDSKLRNIPCRSDPRIFHEKSPETGFANMANISKLTYTEFL